MVGDEQTLYQRRFESKLNHLQTLRLQSRAWRALILKRYINGNIPLRGEEAWESRGV